MAHELLIVRHGRAEPHGLRADAERDLVAEGEAQARAVGGALVALQRVPDVVLASPKVRAWRTAVLAAERFGGEVVRHDALVGFDADEARTVADLGERVMVVGHEPDLSSVVHALTGARLAVPTGGLVVVRLGDGGQLRSFLRAAELARLGG
ncbi:MAG: histidine phosphatase family protein [Solirubrobacteraceae bacterium]